jgi:integrase
MPKLTKTEIGKLGCPPSKAEAFHWDDDMPGFGLRIRASGVRRWVVQYRTGATQRRVLLGDPAVVPPDKARERAKQLLAQVKLGQDPQAERRAERQAIKVSELVEKYLAEAAKRLRPRSLIETTRHLRHHAKPLHTRPAGTLERGEIASLLRDIRDTVGGVTANRVRSSLSAMWAWAMTNGLQDANPITLTAKIAKESSRERVLTDVELTVIWKATDTGHDHDRAVRLLMLLGSRRDEIGRICWSEINEDLWTLPSQRSKNGVPHEVPFPPLAFAQLPPRRPAPADAGESALRDAVFGETEAGFSGWSRCKARLDRRITDMTGKPPIPWTLHDLRRTVSTWLNESGTEPHIVEAVLNHVPTSKRKVAGVYNKASYREPKRAALARWADHIAEITGQTTANVITLKRG